MGNVERKRRSSLQSSTAVPLVLNAADFLFIREDPAFITNDEPQHDRGASLTQKLSGLCASLRPRV